MILPAPTTTAAGCMWLPRLMAKVRAAQAGTLPPAYADVLGHPLGMDGAFLDAFGLTLDAVRTAAARPAEEDEAWFLGLPGVDAGRIAAWNAQAPHLGGAGRPMARQLAWALATYRPDLDPAQVPTIFALLAIDEGHVTAEPPAAPPAGPPGR
jgi:hypothetical protein